MRFMIAVLFDATDGGLLAALAAAKVAQGCTDQKLRAALAAAQEAKDGTDGNYAQPERVEERNFFSAPPSLDQRMYWVKARNFFSAPSIRGFTRMCIDAEQMRVELKEAGPTQLMYLIVHCFGSICELSCCSTTRTPTVHSGHCYFKLSTTKLYLQGETCSIPINPTGYRNIEDVLLSSLNITDGGMSAMLRKQNLCVGSNFQGEDYQSKTRRNFGNPDNIWIGTGYG
jgi:hypothetical protein